MVSKSVIVFDLKFFADIKIIVETVIVLIDDSHATISRWNLQHLQQMPLGPSKVVGFPVEDDAVGNKVEVIISTTDALVTRLQQVLMLVYHSQSEGAIHADYELGQSHLIIFAFCRFVISFQKSVSSDSLKP